ncbi:MAG: ester cyclase [Pseudomonadota bacterium]
MSPNKQIVKAWFDAFPNLTDDVYAALIHTDFFNHASPPPLRKGPDGLKKLMAMVIAAAPDQAYICEHMVEEGDHVVTRTRWTGTLTGTYLGVKGNGKGFDVGQYHTYRIADGKLIEHWAVRDDLAVFSQTGLTPPSPT